MDTERKTSGLIIGLPRGLDKKTAGYWVLALAIFCLASSCALVATLLNRTALSQGSYDEERYMARKEPSLQLEERTRLPEDFSLELHFARRKTPKPVTLRTPPFFSVTARPGTRGTPAPFPRTVPRHPDEYPEETVAPEPVTVPEYPGKDYETLPPEIRTLETEAPHVTPATEEPYVGIDNSTGSQGDGQTNVTESAAETSDVKAPEKGNEDTQSSEATEKATSANVEPSSSPEVASSGDITEASSTEAEPLTSPEATSAAETEAESPTSPEVTSAAETESEPSTEKATEKPEVRQLDEYDDNNFNMLREVQRVP